MTPLVKSGNSPDVWSNEIDLRLSTDPKGTWYGAKIAPFAYLISQNEQNKKLLRLIKLKKSSEGAYSTPEGEEGDISLSETTPFFEPR